MTYLSKLKPDKVLAELLDGKVTVHTSAEKSHMIRAYANQEQPNKGLGDEFIAIQSNGSIQSLSKPMGLFRGYLAVTIMCKSHPDGRAKKQRVESIIEQIEMLVNEVSTNGYYFEFTPDNVIVPTTSNLTIGYSTTVLNVGWHVTDEFYNNN